VPVGTVMAHVRLQGESYVETVNAERANSLSPGSVSQAEPANVSAPRSESTGGGVLSTPGARRLARESGISIAAISPGRIGTRITEEDVRRHLGKSMPAEGLVHADQGVPWTEEKPDSYRMATAHKMEAANSVPHFYLQTWVDASAIVSRDLTQTPTLSRSPEDWVIAGAAQALRQHRKMLRTWAGTTIRVNQQINIGFAVDTPYGLVVPVIRGADALSVEEIGVRRRSLVDRAKNKTLTLSDLSDATFTVTNLGVFGIDLAWPLVNPPQAVILAIGKAQWRPLLVANAFEPRAMIGLTLGADHRPIDGADAARFLASLVEVLEAR
jgi:pyruvate dehydrogenase E2 component (dihydrolipoamide acetyltransferase)